MYRPDRIGPWQLGDLEVVPELLSGAALALLPATDAGGSVKAHVRDATANAATSAASLAQTTGVFALPVSEQLALGVKIIGSPIQDTVEESLVLFGGNISFVADLAGVIVQAIVARTDETDEDFVCQQWVAVQQTSHGPGQLPGVQTYTCNSTAVVGDWRPTGSPVCG